MDVIPQAVAGVGMGMALTALGGGLLPSARRATRRGCSPCAARGSPPCSAAAPLAAPQLDLSSEPAERAGVALVLDALSPQEKVALAPALLESGFRRPRAGLKRAVAERGTFAGPDQATFDHLGRRADDTLVAAVGEAFRSSFLLAGPWAVRRRCWLPARGWPRWPRRGAALGARRPTRGRGAFAPTSPGIQTVHRRRASPGVAARAGCSRTRR